MSRIAVVLPLLLAAPAAMAHQPGDGPPTWGTAWTLSPWVLLPWLLLAGLYAAGLARLWRRAGAGAGIDRLQVFGFASGMLALALATVWPLDAMGEWSLAAHIGQHMLLLAVVPPLLLAGRPAAAIAHVLPARLSGRLHRATARLQALATGGLGIATAAHVGVMLAWHLPAATTAALQNDAVHWVMHASFLLAGLWFWAALLHRIREPETGVGAGLVAIIAVMMAMGFLGALLTFSRRVLYEVYGWRAPALGLDPLLDQQLAGLVMWVPACLPYIIGGLVLARLWLRRAERRSAG